MKTIALKAAQRGGAVLMRRFGRDISIDYKGAVDLVTEADRASEEAIVKAIREVFPRHDILAEEKDYGRLSSTYRWIIDPLDGTTNYAHGYPWFSVSVALEANGEIILGVIYNPFNRELFFAEKGKGAFLNDVQLRVSQADRLEQSLLATGFPYDRKESPVNNYDHFIHLHQASRGCRRCGAATLDLAFTAAGALDGYWEMKLKPWDVAAGKLLVEEAGGRVSDFDGGDLDIYGQECLASNGRIHEEMIGVLQQGLRP